MAIEKYATLFAQTSYTLVDPPKPTAISSGSFKFKCVTCSNAIGPVGISHIQVCVNNFPEFRGCSNCKNIEASKTYKTLKCEHGVVRKFCKTCDDKSGLCEHGNTKYCCTQCKPKIRCMHDLNQENCGNCGGKNTCIHGEVKQNCRTCFPHYFCTHGRRKTACKDCGGSAYCHHEKYKQICRDCNGSNLCEHNTQRKQCRSCDYPNWLKSVISCRLRNALTSQNIEKRQQTLEYLGCSIEELLNIFKQYYHVDNLDSTYHIDHIKPISKFNLEDEQSLSQALHWTNLQPLLAKHNLEKHNKWTPLDEKNWIIEVASKKQIFGFKDELVTNTSNQIAALPHNVYN